MSYIICWTLDALTEVKKPIHVYLNEISNGKEPEYFWYQNEVNSQIQRLHDFKFTFHKYSTQIAEMLHILKWYSSRNEFFVLSFSSSEERTV